MFFERSRIFARAPEVGLGPAHSPPGRAVVALCVTLSWLGGCAESAIREPRQGELVDASTGTVPDDVAPVVRPAAPDARASHDAAAPPRVEPGRADAASGASDGQIGLTPSPADAHTDAAPAGATADAASLPSDASLPAPPDAGDRGDAATQTPSTTAPVPEPASSPAQPTSPQAPAETAHPTDAEPPGEPTTPSVPVKPAEPTTPSVPVKPVEPTPAVPETRDEPTTPNVPEPPDLPEPPNVPETPAEPTSPPDRSPRCTDLVCAVSCYPLLGLPCCLRDNACGCSWLPTLYCR